MIIDSSAIVAILLNEAEAKDIVLAIAESSTPLRISAATYVEIGAVIDRARNPIASRRVDDLITELGILIEDVTSAQARLARDAYRDFGKGLGNRAQLNFGDCFSYALAKSLSEPLLYKGHDFGHTDLECVRITVPGSS